MHRYFSKSLVFALAITVSLAGIGLTAPVFAQDGVSGCVNQYMVYDGDTLSEIARRFNVDMSELATLNGITNPSYIRIGDVLCLDGLVEAQPGPPTEEPPATPVTEPVTPPTSGTGGPVPAQTTPSPLVIPNANASVSVAGRTYTTDAFGYYVVQPKDTLFRIAWAFGVSQSQLAAVNSITNTGLVYASQRLLVPLPTPSYPVPGNVPAIAISPRIAGPGDTVTVEGYNYPPVTEVRIYLEKPSLNRQSNQLIAVTTDASGSFLTPVVIPADWPDGYPVNTRTVSIAGRSVDGMQWGMNFFINTAWVNTSQ